MTTANKAKNGRIAVPALGEEELFSADQVIVRPPNFLRMRVPIRGLSPYMQLRFSQKAQAQMAEKQRSGQQARGKKERAARDFDDDYREAMYLDEAGRHGIPASAFRNALIDACRLSGAKMTLAKMSVFVEADALDARDGTPLVVIRGTPERTDMMVRNATGVVDIRVRPLWREWTATLSISWDGDQFSQDSVFNLLVRAGLQVGVGEGRPFSKKSAGMGMGTFEPVAEQIPVGRA